MIDYMRGKHTETSDLANQAIKSKQACKPKDLIQLKQTNLTAIINNSKGVNLRSEPTEEGSNCYKRTYKVKKCK